MGLGNIDTPPRSIEAMQLLQLTAAWATLTASPEVKALGGAGQ